MSGTTVFIVIVGVCILLCYIGVMVFCCVKNKRQQKAEAKEAIAENATAAADQEASLVQEPMQQQ